MGKKLAPALYKENIIEAKEPQENAFFSSGFVFLLFCCCWTFFFLKFVWIQPSYVK